MAPWSSPFIRRWVVTQRRVNSCPGKLREGTRDFSFCFLVVHQSSFRFWTGAEYSELHFGRGTPGREKKALFNRRHVQPYVSDLTLRWWCKPQISVLFFILCTPTYAIASFSACLVSSPILGLEGLKTKGQTAPGSALNCAGFLFCLFVALPLAMNLWAKMPSQLVM